MWRGYIWLFFQWVAFAVFFPWVAPTVIWVVGYETVVPMGWGKAVFQSGDILDLRAESLLPEKPGELLF